MSSASVSECRVKVSGLVGGSLVIHSAQSLAQQAAMDDVEVVMIVNSFRADLPHQLKVAPHSHAPTSSGATFLQPAASPPLYRGAKSNSCRLQAQHTPRSEVESAGQPPHVT